MSKLSINRETKLCMSLSARPGNFGTRFQNHLYEALSLDYVYKAFTTKDIAASVNGIRALGIRGCAISMPFKESCIAHLDELDPSASAIGAVNTIVNTDGHLKGYNTDYIAVRSLIVSHGLDAGAPFILRGSGGMAKAVASAFRDAGFRHGVIAARNAPAGRALASACGFAWTSEPEGAATLLVNVTPIGMTGGTESADLAFPPHMISAATTVFDVVALPPETPLLREARAHGRHIIGGQDVLVLQGVEQFVLYTGVRPDAEALRAAADFAFA